MPDTMPATPVEERAKKKISFQEYLKQKQAQKSVGGSTPAPPTPNATVADTSSTPSNDVYVNPFGSAPSIAVADEAKPSLFLTTNIVLPASEISVDADFVPPPPPPRPK